jgi:hypothetical protein
MTWCPNTYQDWSLMSADDSGEVHFWQIVIFPNSFVAITSLSFPFFHFRTFIQIREKSDYFSSPKTSPIFWMWFLIKTFPSRYVFAELSA